MAGTQQVKVSYAEFEARINKYESSKQALENVLNILKNEIIEAMNSNWEGKAKAAAIAKLQAQVRNTENAIRKLEEFIDICKQIIKDYQDTEENNTQGANSLDDSEIKW